MNSLVVRYENKRQPQKTKDDLRFLLRKIKMAYLFRRGQLAPSFDTVRSRGQLSYKQKKGR
jgi:hypothetical protein